MVVIPDKTAVMDNRERGIQLRNRYDLLPLGWIDDNEAIP